MKQILTIDRERIQKLLSYDADTGLFTWIAPSGNNSGRFVGKVAGSVGPRGYRIICICGVFYRSARLAWAYFHGDTDLFIDHINGNKSDDRIANLRPATKVENGQNLRRPRSDNTTGFLGVSVSRGKFLAKITIDGHNRHLGYFDTPEAASEAYLQAKRTGHEFCTI